MVQVVPYFSISTAFATTSRASFLFVGVRSLDLVVGQLLRFAHLSLDPSWTPCTLLKNLLPPYLYEILSQNDNPHAGAVQLTCDALRLRMAVHMLQGSWRPPQEPCAMYARGPCGRFAWSTIAARVTCIHQTSWHHIQII